MAAALQPTDDIHTNIDNKQLEIFSLIWLDPTANINAARNTEQKLCAIIDDLKKFQDVKECQQYIEQRSPNERLLVIVSGQMGQEIVPSIHNLQQVISIYVFCMDKKKNEEWTRKFKKVKAVIVELDELVSKIKNDYKIQKTVEEPLAFNSYGAGKSTQGLNDEFVFSQVLIDCLLRLKPTQADKQEFIDLCKTQYKGKIRELKNINEFDRDYSPKKALWWYTRESFFYTTLNAALRTQNIHMIFLFRAYISDIHSRLKKYQSLKSLTVYRGQRMSSDELKILQQSRGELISVNSFFSTTAKYEKALEFLNQSDDSSNLERVLFTIVADPIRAKAKPFCDISAFSAIADESEILFMLGSIFHLKTIDRVEADRIWSVRMTLCGDDENDLKEVIMSMKEKNGDGNTNLHILGKMLWKMGKPDLAEKYFNRLLNELPLNDPLCCELYEDLRMLASQMKQFDKMEEWKKRSIKAEKDHQSTVNPNINQTNSSTGQSTSRINNNTNWKQDGSIVAGGNGEGGELNQLYWPHGIYVDDEDQCIYIADSNNHRIVECKRDAKIGIVAGGKGKGSGMDQLNCPTDVVVDKKNDTLIICDQGNRRVVRWSFRDGATGEEIISNIDCSRLTADNDGNLYVSDFEKHEVRRWKIGETNGTIVAGGNGEGDKLNQLSYPTYIFVDKDHSVYVSDNENHRVMKWVKGAKEGIVVAGGVREGVGLAQLCYPQGVTVDHLDNVYVADSYNNRIMCWPKGSSKGRIIIGEKEKAQKSAQFNHFGGLSFDQQDNLCIVDYYKHRVQKYGIDLN